jgi:protocatechuate 3,4-dioxygenase beta subunit
MDALSRTTVRGTVTSPDGSPVPKALVVVYPAVMGRGEVPATASTDEKGRFRLEVAFVGDLLACVDAPGFAPRSGIPASFAAAVTVRLEKGRTLEGTVRDGATLRPLSGARVLAGSRFPFGGAHPRAGWREASTDGNGRYRLEHLPQQLDAVQATAKGYAGAFATVLPTAARADFTLPRGGWLSGTVRTAKGTPVKGAIVTATAFEGSPAGRHGREETDVLGRFEIIGLTPGLYYVAAHHPGFAAAFAPPVRVRESLSIDLVLKDATTASGRLVDADGAPSAGTIVLDEVEGGFPSLLGDVLCAAAGPDGRFRLRDLPPGHHRATVSARGHTQTPLEFQTREGAVVDLGDVSLASGLAIRGRIKDGSGAPVSGARIEAGSIDGHGSFAADTTDGDGAFGLAGLGDGRYRLSLTVGGVYRAGREVIAGSEPIVWTLEPTGAVAGAVIDASGRPVDAFFVTARRLGDQEMSWQSPHARGTGGAFRIDDVPPGRYALRVSAPDLADAVVSDVAVEAVHTTEAGRIRLGPAGRVRGTVVDTDGRPVAEAEVTAWSQRDHESGSLSHRMPQARTSAEGTFEIAGLNPGTVMVEVHHPRLGSGRAAGLEVDPAQGPAVTRVVLEPSGRLEGKVREQGQGLAATVSAMPLGAFGRERASVLTEEDGSFVFENLPPGQFLVEFRPVAQPARSLPERSVWVRKGETTVVDADFRQILIHGRVTRSGAPTEGLRVAFDTEGRHTGWPVRGGPGPQPMVSLVAADGSYSLLLSQPGPHTARVETLQGTVLHSRTVTVPDAEEHPIDLEFASLSVKGVLIDEATQRPIASGEISVVGKNKSDLGRPTRTGEDGRFDIPLEPGTYVLYARAPGYASAQSSLEVGAQGVGEQRLALARGFKIRGRVVDARGQGAATVLVFATGESSPEPVAHGQAAADGSFELSGLADARYNVLAGSDLAGYAVKAGVGPEDGALVLSLQAPGRVRVTVQDAAGAPAAGVFFVITRVDDATVFGISSFFSRTDGNGVVELSVPVGRIELTAQHRASARAVTVEVRPGELAQAAIKLAPQDPSP